jgi:hypothetical protein
MNLWIWIVLALLVAVVALRRLHDRHARRRGDLLVDDAAIERIMREGTLTADDDEPLDEEEIARAEEEFWEESWDEPEDYGR